ncbi:MRP interacting1 [Zea mays]|uniref:MRP interacting1 n=1 Tax=Zea mays TaxID=4577 RepID=A0A1D6GA05_MAIZE|nr:MRP interacting1 [Zea mays]
MCCLASTAPSLWQRQYRWSAFSSSVLHLQCCDGAGGRGLVAEDRGDHLPDEPAKVGEQLRPDRAGVQGAQHAADAVPLRGVPRGREAEGEQAAQEAPALPRRRQRAAALPRHHALVRARRRRRRRRRFVPPLRLRQVRRVPHHPARLLRQEGGQDRRGRVHHVHQRPRFRVHRGCRRRRGWRWQCQWHHAQGAAGVQGDRRPRAQAAGQPQGVRGADDGLRLARRQGRPLLQHRGAVPAEPEGAAPVLRGHLQTLAY